MTKAGGQVKAVEESRAMGVLRGAAGAVGAVAQGVAGNVGAMAQEVMSEGIKKSHSYQASKENSVGTTVAANENDSLTKAVSGSISKGFNDSAGKSEVQSTSVSLSHAGLAAIASSGNSRKSGQQFQQDAANSAAKLRNGGVTKKDGSAFSKEEIAAADNFVATSMVGHSSGNPDVDQFKKNVLFENALTGAVNGSFGSGGAMPAGANFNAPLPTSNVESKPAVAATKGHWAKSNAKDGQPQKTQDWTLQNWKNGDDPTNTKGVQAAAKSGYKWVAGTAGSAAVDGGSHLANPALSNQGMNTHVNESGVGANMASAKGSAAYQAMASRIIGSANATLEKQGHKAVSSEVALQQFSPEQFAEYDKASEKGKELIIAAAAAQVVGGVVGAVADKFSHGGPAATTGAPGATPTAGTPAAGSTPTAAPGSTPATPAAATPAKRVPLNAARVKAR
jgi:hypothetical protein